MCGNVAIRVSRLRTTLLTSWEAARQASREERGGVFAICVSAERNFGNLDKQFIVFRFASRN
jgi:hypothetical protein